MALIAGIGALILLVIFIIQNTHAVHISFLGAHASLSLAVALLIAAIVGALVMAGWWPHSRNALTELTGLIAALDSRREGAAASVHRDEWDEIPHRLTAGGHTVRVDWFTTIPRHTVSVTAAGQELIALLVVPPGTAEDTARAAMNMAVTSGGPVQAADILATSEPGACQRDQ